MDLWLWVYYTLALPWEKLYVVYFASSYMKNFVVFPAQPIFPVIFIYCIAFGSVSNICWLIKSIAIILRFFLSKGN